MAGRFCKTRWEESRGKTYITNCTRIFLGLQKYNETSKIEKKTYLLVMNLSGDIPDIMHQ